MAEFGRVGSGVALPKEKLHGSPSTGSEEGHDGAIGEDFDPFLGDQDEGDGANIPMLVAPPETQYVFDRTIFVIRCLLNTFKN